MNRGPGGRAGPAIALVVALASCGTGIGPAVPECDEMSSAIVMQAQAVAGTDFAACLHGLQPGWGYQDLEARSGQARFLLDSDRMGLGFLEVTLEEACDTSNAEAVPSDELEVPLYVETMEREVEVTLAVVAEGDDPDSQAYAHELVAELRTRTLRARPLTPTFLEGHETTADRISAGLELGYPVLVVGPFEREEGTVELHLRETGNEAEIFRSISLGEALDRIEDRVGVARYRANWYYPFESGCVTYSIDATGDGVQTVVGDIQETLGLAPLAEARRLAEEEGLVVP